MSESETSNKIEKQIELKATPARVWRALTDYLEFGEWFRVNLEGPFSLGEKAAGYMSHPGFEHLRFELKVTALEHERVFAFTWHPCAIDPQVDYSKETPTLVEFRLEKTASGTLLKLTESGFENIPEHRRFEAQRMNDGGWTYQMKNIEAHIAKAE